VSGSTLTITGAGTVTVTAAQAGNADYAAATSVSQSFTAAKAALTVTANNASITYGQAIPSFTYALTGFVGTDTSSVVSGTATETTTATSTSAPGTYPITFSSEGLTAANYTFTYVNGTLTISGNAAQTITFGALPNVTYGVSPITLTATASSGLPVSYTVTGPATVSGSTLTITGAGTVTVTAAQAGNADYAAATSVSQSFTAAKAAPTITFAVANQTFGTAPFAVSATSNSTGAITYSVVSGPATISGSTVTLTGVGTVTLQASQAASGNYTTETVQTSFTVTAPATAVTLQFASTTLVYPLPPAFEVTIAPQGKVAPTGSIQILDGSTVVGTYPVPKFTDGHSFGLVLPPLNVGKHPMSAAYSGDTNYPPGTSATVTLTITPGPVTLRLSCGSTNLAAGQSLNCEVAASEGLLPVSGTLGYAMNNGTGSQITLKNGLATLSIADPPVGSDVLTITYAAQGNYQAAQPVSVKFTVTSSVSEK